jgi:hypothetical protein
VDGSSIAYMVFILILLFGGEGTRQFLKHRERMKAIEVERVREQRKLEERRAEITQAQHEQNLRLIFGQEKPLGIADVGGQRPDVTPTDVTEPPPAVKGKPYAGPYCD